MDATDPLNLVTLLTFNYAHEPAVIAGRLESEGIQVFIDDEYTVQVDPFYSNAIGGVKLKVMALDAEHAIGLLREWGYMNDPEYQEASIQKILDDFTKGIPLLNKIKVAYWIPILIVLIPVVLYFLAKFSGIA